MTDRRTALILAGAALLVIALAALVLRQRDSIGPPAGAPTPAAVATEPDVSPTPSQTPFDSRYRLAGIAVGSARYVVVEGSDGTSGLYRIGEPVPGLGRVAGIDLDSATFEGDSGTVQLRVLPAPTTTTTPTRPTLTPTAPLPLITQSARPPLRVRTVGGSSP